MKIERVLSLLESVQEQGVEAPASIGVVHCKDGYALVVHTLGNRDTVSLGEPIDGFPWMEYRSSGEKESIRYFKSIDLAIEDATRSLEAALKNKVAVLEQQVAAARNAIG